MVRPHIIVKSGYISQELLKLVLRNSIGDSILLELWYILSLKVCLEQDEKRRSLICHLMKDHLSASP